ncbi:hypothetical protein J2T57_001110 [Natronocella acetinitrilica]|uniref:RHS repeat-associated core domain-containing protein n=1 Tax=Natronocella acetinitrilica TaxID=414046 RepID=A0AAE3G1M0_9GAMM|nr:hypothetical protein [Natronocella acetinitrilica]MCP1674011.1 hypothetical protein [Natronocella acetinitrilica]
MITVKLRRATAGAFWFEPLPPSPPACLHDTHAHRSLDIEPGGGEPVAAPSITRNPCVTQRREYVSASFNYDVRGNATADGQALYAYDGAGNLVSADTGLLLGEYDLGGGFREYVHIGTQLVSRIKDDTTEVGVDD